MRSDATNVAQYLAQAPPPRRATLRRLRATIREALPRATEGMRYGHPVYDLDGPLIALGSQKHYVAVYVGEPEAIAMHRGALATVNVAKSCIRIREGQTPPWQAIRQVVRAAARLRRTR